MRMRTITGELDLEKLENYKGFAVNAARIAGKIAMEHFEKPISSYMIGDKGNSNSIVTKADKESEAAIIEYLSKKAPGTSFEGEEGGKVGSSSLRWIIDPVDGTNNFAYKIPLFCTSIGLAKGNELLAGAVFNPYYKEMFEAHKGGGAFLNGKRLRVSKIVQKKDMIVATDWPHEAKGREFVISKFISKEATRTRYIPILGSAALSLAWVAAGRFHAYAAPTLHSWDMAAGALMVQEAGGKNFRWDGSKWMLPYGDIVATNGTFPL